MHSIEAFAHPSLRNTNYNYNMLEQSYNHLSVLPHKSFNLMEVGIILGQDAYELPIGLQEGNTKWTFSHSNRARMGSQWTHYGQKKTKCLSFRLHWSCDSAWEYPNLLGHRNLCFQNQRRQSVKEGTAGKKDASEYDNVHRRVVRSGIAVE